MPSALRPADWFFFDDDERALTADILAFIAENSAAHSDRLTSTLDLLASCGDLIRRSPPIAGAASLIELLCRVPDYDLDLHIPTKAVLGQAYLIAKINFFKAAGYSLEALGGSEVLVERLARETGQAIYSKLGEELFVSIVTDPRGEREVKVAAARYLFRIWEERLGLEIDQFAPLLESVWVARNKVRPVLGTMLGTQEVFQLFREARDDRFLEYFDSDAVTQEQLLAFEEFLFGMSHEEIVQLREYIIDSASGVLTIEEARSLLGRSKKSWAPQADGAQALYTSYKKRRVKAAYRALTGAAGPKKTAEEYVMTAFLRKEEEEGADTDPLGVLPPSS